MTRDTHGTRDTPDRTYKDDPDDFGQSSETAEGRPSDRSSGDGPGEHGDAAPKPRGSQSDWQQPAASASTPDTDVESRSADPGQSSYGGFKDEGPATPDGHPRRPDDKSGSGADRN